MTLDEANRVIEATMDVIGFDKSKMTSMSLKDSCELYGRIYRKAGIR